MDSTRRLVLQALGAGSLSPLLVSARGLEAFRGLAEQQQKPGRPKLPFTFAPPKPGQIRIDGNENPLGPGSVAMDALAAAFSDAGRYPNNSRVDADEVMEILARTNGAAPDNIVLGAGSGEILRTSVRAFTSRDKHLVSVSPTFGTSAAAAAILGHPVKEVGLDAALRIDLDALASAARGAGLVYFCNPNNPTATLHSGDSVAALVERVGKDSPETVFLIDEAYHHYVTEPSYRSAVPLALDNPTVVVTRTFSKAFGMAGLRLGYAIGRKETVAKLDRLKLRNNTNVLVLAAAKASLLDPGHIDEERERNTLVRAFTVDFFRKRGYEVAETQANFLFVNLRRPSKDFREACEKRDVFVGRDFPPLEATHTRISMGTMEEMRKATRVFEEVLAAPAVSG
jgi:histidinol-phosphate aminotransferase